MDLSYLLQQTIIDDLSNAHHILGNTMLDKLWPWGPFLSGALERRMELTRTMTGAHAHLQQHHRPHTGTQRQHRAWAAGWGGHRDSDSCHREVQGLKCFQHHTILRPKPKMLHLSIV